MVIDPMPPIITEKKKEKIKKEATNCGLISLQPNPCEVNENYENIQTRNLGPHCNVA